MHLPNVGVWNTLLKSRLMADTRLARMFLSTILIHLRESINLLSHRMVTSSFHFITLPHLTYFVIPYLIDSSGISVESASCPSL